MTLEEHRTTVLRSGGFDVYDVGKDVPAHTILEACQEYKPDIVACQP